MTGSLQLQVLEKIALQSAIVPALVVAREKRRPSYNTEIKQSLGPFGGIAVLVSKVSSCP